MQSASLRLGAGYAGKFVLRNRSFEAGSEHRLNENPRFVCLGFQVLLEVPASGIQHVSVTRSGKE